MKNQIIYNLLDKQETIENQNFEFIGFLDFSGKKYKYVSFKNCVFNDKTHFESLDSIIEVSFINCIFTEVVYLSEFREINRLVLKNCKFTSIYLENIQANLVRIVDCEVMQYLELEKIKADIVKIESILIDIKGELFVDSIETEIMEISSSPNTSFEKITLEKFNHLIIAANIIQLNFEANEFSKLELSRSLKEPFVVNELNMIDLRFNGIITIEETTIINIIIMGCYSDAGSLSITESKLHNTQINAVFIKNLILNQVTFLSPPDFSKSNLGSMQLINVTWADKQKSLQDSFLDEFIPMFYIFRIKSLKRKNNHFDETNISELKYNIETYRQLKVASINCHNQMDGLAFYRNEMKLHWKLIRIEGDIPIYDRILVFLNRWTSDFGQNWILPLIWLIGFHFLLCICLASFDFSFTWADFENGFAQYIELLNPAHKSQDWIVGFDVGINFLMRISSGYFIYHLIKATRKFGKV